MAAKELLSDVSGKINQFGQYEYFDVPGGLPGGLFPCKHCGNFVKTPSRYSYLLNQQEVLKYIHKNGPSEVNEQEFYRDFHQDSMWKYEQDALREILLELCDREKMRGGVLFLKPEYQIRTPF